MGTTLASLASRFSDDGAADALLDLLVRGVLVAEVFFATLLVLS